MALLFLVNVLMAMRYSFFTESHINLRYCCADCMKVIDFTGVILCSHGQKMILSDETHAKLKGHSVVL